MTTKTEIRNEMLNETCWSIKHDSGLQIYAMPKAGYASAYAVFGTKYGSIDTKIQTKDGEIVSIPEGTAHFLEHKLFESEELDAFARYAETGASANAFTSFDTTCYLFSSSGDFNASLEILLDFVQSPYFTAETVKKEQGIIGQEIRMYKDVAEWEVLFNLLRALYHKHPVRIDIAGTEQSIAEITSDMLYDCYNSFYNLNNMVLAVAGNIDVDEVLKTCDRLLKKAEPFTFERKPVDEPKEIVEKLIEEKLSVAAPIFSFGYKESAGLPEQSLKERVAMGVLLEILAGTTSELYNRLMSEGKINTSFGFEQFNGFGYSATIFNGESHHTEEVVDAVKAEIARLRKSGIDKAEFERIRRKLYGRCVMSYNDVDDLANDLVSCHFANEGMFDEVEIYKTLTLADVEEVFSVRLNEAFSALSIIRPIEE